MRKNKFYFAIFVVVIGVISNCTSYKHSSSNLKSLGLYVNILPSGFLRQYLLFDTYGHVYYFYDTLASCADITKKIKERYRQVGDFKIVKDSITFAFDSCVSTTYTGSYIVNGVTHTYTHRAFDYDNPQHYYGEMSHDSIYFLLRTGDTLKWNEIYVRCRD